MQVSEPPNVRHVMPGMRWMLAIASGLVFLVGIQLFVFTERTGQYFAWTIQPPLTAAFLGAAYWSSFVLESLAARERIWAHARIALPTVLVFTTLTLIITLVHLDRFHLHSPNKPSTIFATWVWIAVYAIVPPVLSVLLARQLRMQGGDPPRTMPLAPWVRVILTVQALVLVAFGIALLLTPLTTSRLWPWTLTALTGRAIGAWLTGLGVAEIQVSGENDLLRARAAFASSTVFGVLELVALARYSRSLAFSNARTWVFLAFIMSFLVVGGYGMSRLSRASRVHRCARNNVPPASLMPPPT